MNTRRPSAATVTAMGYQPVGMKPATVDGPVVPFSGRSITATVLLSALATNKRFPSGEAASQLGVDPGGDLGCSAMLIRSRTIPVSGSWTYTRLVLEQVTYRCPWCSSMAVGCAPVLKFNTVLPSFGSRMEMLSSPQFET